MFANFSESFSPRPLYFTQRLIFFDNQKYKLRSRGKLSTQLPRGSLKRRLPRALSFIYLYPQCIIDSNKANISKTACQNAKNLNFLNFCLKLWPSFLNLDVALLLCKSYQNKLILSENEIYTKCQIISQYELLNIFRGSTI